MHTQGKGVLRSGGLGNEIQDRHDIQHDVWAMLLSVAIFAHSGPGEPFSCVGRHAVPCLQRAAVQQRLEKEPVDCI